MRRLSLNARMMQDDLVSDQIYVVLIEIDHPELPRPIRLSTDNADRIQADPPIYGTRSSWRGANPITDPYLWIVASAILPGDQDDTPAAATIALENLDREMVRLVRSLPRPPRWRWRWCWRRPPIRSRPNGQTCASSRPTPTRAKCCCRSAESRSRWNISHPGG